MSAAELHGSAWLNKSLNFGCTQCGKCCTSININKYNNKTAGISFIEYYSIINSLTIIILQKSIHIHHLFILMKQKANPSLML